MAVWTKAKMGEATDLNPVVLGWVRIPRRPPLPITTNVVGKDCTIVLVAGGESLQGRVTVLSPELAW